MAKIWSDILVPLAIVGAVAAQTVGVEVNRAARLRTWFPQRDTVVTTSLPDSTLRSPLDSIAEEEEFDLFAEPQEDTTPKVYARDTMKVPDSLKLVDPFLYQW